MPVFFTAPPRELSNPLADLSDAELLQLVGQEVARRETISLEALYSTWDTMRARYLREISCLDKGFCRLVDFMGHDLRIPQAARLSYAGEGTKRVTEDKGLINYLMRHFHTSPVEMVEFVFHEKMPIFVARQQVRHRTASLNEISGRYSILRDEFYVPEAVRMQKQSTTNRQGSSAELINDVESYLAKMVAEQEAAYSQYEEYVETGMARELARINLPLSTYTQWYWKMDAHNLFHFLGLRLTAHAQYEARIYAEAKYELMKPVIPWTCEAFEEHVRNAKRLGQHEWAVIMKYLKDAPGLEEAMREDFKALGWTSRRIEESMDKIWG